MLGVASGEPQHQQSVRLGVNEGGQDVRCLLGSPGGRNIVCICGAPGSGKSNTLGTLVMGALRGEGVARASTPKSAVILFHNDLSGCCPLVVHAQHHGFRAKVFAFEDELAAIRKEYTDVPEEHVKSLRFRLELLPDDVILRCMEIADSGATGKSFQNILQKQRKLGRLSVEQLQKVVVSEPSLDTRQKDKVLRGLGRLAPFISRMDDSSLDKELRPGELTVVDCGRGDVLARRLTAWEMVLVVLAKHWESRQADEHHLLVFDELHQVFQRAESEIKQFVTLLSGLADRMGRHQQVSILAASQKPRDFTKANDLWEGANVLLFHGLQGPAVDVPQGTLWQLASKHAGLSSLKTGEAWYFSYEQNNVVKGHLKVDKRF